MKFVFTILFLVLSIHREAFNARAEFTGSFLLPELNILDEQSLVHLLKELNNDLDKLDSVVNYKATTCTIGILIDE